MIDPKLLTPEFGFEEGVVVEAIWSDTPTDRGPYYFEVLDLEDWLDAVSLKVLTGPMAIWNFAPEWADVLHRKIDGGFDWLRGTVEGWKMSYGDGEFSQRPWWAKKEK